MAKITKSAKSAQPNNNSRSGLPRVPRVQPVCLKKDIAVYIGRINEVISYKVFIQHSAAEQVAKITKSDKSATTYSLINPDSIMLSIAKCHIPHMATI